MFRSSFQVIVDTISLPVRPLPLSETDRFLNRHCKGNGIDVYNGCAPLQHSR